MDKLIIDRSKWLRGEGSDNSFLLRKGDGKMCCLGFEALRRGFTPEQITAHRSPAELGVLEGLTRPENFSTTAGHPIYMTTKTCGELMEVNDAFSDEEAAEAYEAEHVAGPRPPALIDSEDEREATIAALFAKIGVAVEFVG